MNAGMNGRRCVLLVEDNPGDADLIRELIEASGLRDEVLHAIDLATALQQLESIRPDAILLDLRLPDASGLDCVDAIVENADGVPIVVLTGLDDEALALACLEAGAQDYLSKDEIRAQSLRRAIGYAVARGRERVERHRAEALQQRLAAIVEGSSDAIVSMTPDGTVTSWNGGAERIFGYRSDEAIGAPVSIVMRPADAAEEERQKARVAAVREGRDAGEAEEIARLRRDGSRVILSAVASSIRDASGAVVALAGICRDITDAKRRDEELRQRNAELAARDVQMRALTARINQIREEERTRISREVHDVLGQLLTGLKMDLRWIGKRLPETAAGDGTAARLEEAARLVDRIVATVQRIAAELRPSALDALGLPAAIRDEARRFAERSGVAHEVRIDSKERPSAEISTHLFRILQEFLTNVARHARATRVEIAFDRGEDAWELRVEDDGVGIPTGAEYSANSLGLLGARERASLLGGMVHVERSIHRGTRATASVPFRASEMA